MLSTADKAAIQRSGEITRQIEFNDPARHNLLRGTLRIIKTEDPKTFNFVEVGEWVNHGHYSNSDETIDLEFRDSVVYDENGNTVSRTLYQKHNDVFQKKEDWTSEINEGRFLQHVKIYENGILAAEYTRNVLNYLEPKSDLLKNKVPFGTDKSYFPNGKLQSAKSYDINGELISEVKHS